MPEKKQELGSSQNVNEPIVLYETNSMVLDFWNTIISKVSTPIFKMTSFEKMTLLGNGIKKGDLEHFKAKASLDYDKLSQALTVTRATLINKKKNETFNGNVSEKIVALTDLYFYGYSVFENEEKFNQWMFVPNDALGGKKPFDIIENQFGREEIKNLIGRIEYGIYS
jgi:putative toxin-antitoxin system antitoxin component (TIGR02293 family)